MTSNGPKLTSVTNAISFGIFGDYRAPRLENSSLHHYLQDFAELVFRAKNDCSATSDWEPRFALPSSKQKQALELFKKTLPGSAASFVQEI